MVLTPEQQERIRLNRERAFELQKQRQTEHARQSSHNIDRDKKLKREGESTVEETSAKKPKVLKQNDYERNATKISGRRPVDIDTEKAGDADAKDDELEEFEVLASEWVTKAEAKKMYCLPEGTLAVCEYVEKQNPHHKGWAPMKMYSRVEIRKRARQRYGGMQGLIAERTKRTNKRFQKDLENSKAIFNA